MLLKEENEFLNRAHLLECIKVKYEKRLSEKQGFWDKSVDKIKMDFTLIPQHDERVAFWLIRNNNKITMQCYVFKYQYRPDWQLILTKEFQIKPFEDGFNVSEAEKEIEKIFEEFLELECKDTPKDDEIQGDFNSAFEVEFFNELPEESDPNLKEGQIWKVKQTRDYNFAGYYIWEDKRWCFERDLD